MGMLERVVLQALGVDEGVGEGLLTHPSGMMGIQVRDMDNESLLGLSQKDHTEEVMADECQMYRERTGDDLRLYT